MKEIYIKHVIDIIKKNIMKNENLYNLFKHHNQKYSLDDLLLPTILILIKGLPYRDIIKYTNISFTNVHKFISKLINFKIIDDIRHLLVDKYLHKLGGAPINAKTDTTLIPNKYGIDLVSYYPELKNTEQQKYH